MKQITIVADDKVGLLADISYILGKARVNIESLSVDVHGGKAVINITVKDDARASSMLGGNGYKVLSSEVFVLRLHDGPGELSKLSNSLKEEGINIESLYLLSREGGVSLDALKVDKPKKARKLLEPYLVGSP